MWGNTNRRKIALGMGAAGAIGLLLITVVQRSNGQGDYPKESVSSHEEQENTAQAVVPEEEMQTGQNFIRIEGNLVGSLIRDLNDGVYYMGIEKEDGAINPAGVKTECSNLVQYEDSLYFINDSFPVSMQNILCEGTGKGRISCIQGSVEGASLSQLSMLTLEDELTNRFYLFEDRIYYQVVEQEGEEDLRYRIYSRTLDGRNREEVWSGVNWSCDFAMEGGYLYIAKEQGGVTRLHVERKVPEEVLINVEEYDSFYHYGTIKEMIPDGDQLYLLVAESYDTYTYKIQMSGNNIGDAERGKRNYDVKTGMEIKDYIDILQRESWDFYVREGDVIYKMPVAPGDTDDAKRVEVGRQVQEERELNASNENAVGPNLKGSEEKLIGVERNQFVYITEGNSEGIYTTEQGVLMLYGGKIVEKSGAVCVYQLKDKKPQLLSSHGDESVEDTMIGNLFCYGDYIYYTLVDHTSSSVSGWRNDYIYRMPANGGTPELLTTCNDSDFFIFNNKMYYLTREKRDHIFQMDLDGGNKSLMYRGEIDSFTVGGGNLYVNDKQGIRGVDLETGLRKYYQSRQRIRSMYFEGGYLFINYLEEEAGICCLDVLTGNEKWINDESKEEYIDGGRIYSINIKDEPEEGFKTYSLQIRDENGLTTEHELLSYPSDHNKALVTAQINAAGGDIIVKIECVLRGRGGTMVTAVDYFKQDSRKIWEEGPAEYCRFTEE